MRRSKKCMRSKKNRKIQIASVNASIQRSRQASRVMRTATKASIKTFKSKKKKKKKSMKTTLAMVKIVAKKI